MLKKYIEKIVKNIIAQSDKYDKKISNIEQRIWDLENPPKFKVGDYVIYKNKKYKIIKISTRQGTKLFDILLTPHFMQYIFHEYEIISEEYNTHLQIEEQYLQPIKNTKK